VSKYTFVPLKFQVLHVGGFANMSVLLGTTENSTELKLN